MPYYFMRDTPLQALEQLMMSQPGQKPRGGGIYRSPFHYTPKDVACEYCQNYDRKHPCRLCECTCLEERIEAGVFYNFDAEGKMTDAPIPTPDPDPNPDPNPEVKNGIVSEDGELYYYVDGVKTYAGLIQIDGDYYYVNSYCKVITSQRYWVSKTNNLLPATFYTFGADGKMVR